MPQVHYPFIDVAVHPAVRARFAAGDAVVLFSRDLADVLWANGEGARLFGHGAIYDMIETGPERGGVAFRQLGAAAAQLATVGDKRGFVMRVTSGFRSAAVPAEVNLIVVGRDEAVMFSAPAAAGKRDISSLLGGFDDPDTHMALLGADGEVLVASPAYPHVGVSPDTARALIGAASRSADGLVKRPIPSGSGYLPAAIGRLADDLYLLFCVETSIGRMDAPEADSQSPQVATERDEGEEVIHKADETVEAKTPMVVPEPDSSVTAPDGSSVESAQLDEAPVIGAQADQPEDFVSDIDQTMVETSASDVEEGETEADIGDLAALDGVSPEEVDAALAQGEADANEVAQIATSDDHESAFGEDVADVDNGQPTELYADSAKASAETLQNVWLPIESEERIAETASDVDEDNRATEASVEQSLAPAEEADVVEASERETVSVAQPTDEPNAPEAQAGAEFVAAETSEAEVSLVEGSGMPETELGLASDFPTEPRADIAGASVDEVTALTSDEPVQPSTPMVETEPSPADTPQTLQTGFVSSPTSADDVLSDGADHAEPTELDADIAEVSAGEVTASVSPVESDELTADLIETADVALEAPEEYREIHSEFEAPLPVTDAGEADHADVEPAALAAEDTAYSGDATEPTELDADIAEASAEKVPAAVSPVESDELTADLHETDDVTLEAPEEYREVHSEIEAPPSAMDDGEPDHIEGAPAASRAEDAASSEHAAVETDETVVSPDQSEQPVSEFAANTQPPVDLVAPDVVVAETADGMPESGFVALEQASGAGTGIGLVEGEDAPAAEAGQDVHDGAETNVEPEPEATEGMEPQHPFRFDRGARPVRFVWKLDANGVFAEVSEEFQGAVGPHAGDIVGHSFRDLAALFGLDPEGQITALLDRRDTWSGRMVKWPVEGTDLVVPVDLAALPTYSRSREFDGFRGFGIIRVSDAETDPNGHGLTIAASIAQPTPDEADAGFSTDVAQEARMDEFRGEVPALDIVSNPMATFADKVVQLEERRNRAAREGLSPSEQAALKEIARQLEPFGKRPNEDILKSSSGLLQTEDAEATADEHIEEALERAGDAEIHATDEDYGEALANSERETRAIDDQKIQNLFEDLGSGPGLTPYAIDQVPMAILIHAGDLLIEMNAEFRRLTGYADIDDLDRAGGLDALITRREGPDAGVYLVRADGTQVLVSARLQSVRYEGSSALMLALTPAMGTLAAATTEPTMVGESEPARKLAALQVEIEELRSILETATDGVVVLDMEGRIRSVNRSAAALFNFDDNEIVGKPFAMLFAHESQKSVQDYLSGLAGHGVASVLNDGREVIGREASGGFIPLFMTMGRMPGSNSYCAVIRDITQWKRSEEELRTAKRAAETANQHKSDFLARVSHEIRTPLNAIIGFADMIATEHFGPAGHPRYAEYASDIGRSGRHVLDIVNDLLDISKIEAGEMDLDFGAVGLNDCVSEAVSLVQPQANAQRVIIRTALSQAVPDVVADLRSIKQIALNILANAIRYTPSGGQIVVSTAYEPSGSVTLRIRDTGVGMSKAELEQAMKPFGQVAPGTRQRGDGTGLGLPLTKAMTEANRATFAIHSAPNEGTLVEISFPPQRVLAD